MVVEWWRKLVRSEKMGKKLVRWEGKLREKLCDFCGCVR
jgi:hypothetical protein